MAAMSLTALFQPAGDAQQNAKAAASPPAVRATDFSKVIPLLPEPPQGWTADKPDGSTTDTEGFSITTAGRTYRQGTAEDVPTVSINITDTASNKQFLDTATAAWNATSEATDGYTKAVTIDGNRGFEQFEKDARTGNLWVVVNGRYLVQVEITNLPPEELQAWIKRVDLKKLAALK